MVFLYNWHKNKLDSSTYILEYADLDDDFWEDMEKIDVVAPLVDDRKIKDINTDTAKAWHYIYDILKA